ncbi:MAG: adenosylcobinamide-GDP ribazoletransferase [Pseudomonadota bacterium]
MERTESVIDWRDIPAALGFLTRLPIPVDGDWAVARGARSAWAYPLAGLFVGVLLAAIAFAASRLGLSSALAAALGLAATIVVTGALHEDGLADTADGLWGGWTPARRLEIMADSRIGAYGVLALVIMVLTSWLALSELLRAGAYWAITALPITSRAVMPALMGLPHARPGGVSAAIGRPPRPAIWLAAALGLVALLPLGWDGLAAGIVIASVAAGMGRLALAKIGGQTGDILGAAQQISQLAGWLTLAALL